METKQVIELGRAAHDAERLAHGADHKAELAILSIDSHEKVCAERYTNINMQLKAIPDIYKAINTLSSRVYMGVGLCLGVTGLSLVVGIIYGIMKIAGKV